MSWYDDDYDYNPNWKPPMKGKPYHELMIRLKAKYQKQVQMITTDMAEMYETGREHAQRLKEENAGGPFVAFLQVWNDENQETEEQRDKRWCANYIRHHLTSYDKDMQDALSQWWMPEVFFDDIWKAVMAEIVGKYPELQIAYDRGIKAKQDYKQYKKDRAVAQQRAFEEMIERQIQAEKDYPKQRSASSRMVTHLMSVGDEVKVYHKGDHYDGIIKKVNKVTAKVTFIFKDGSTVEKNTHGCYLYEDNRDKYTEEFEGYVPMSGKTNPGGYGRKW